MAFSVGISLQEFKHMTPKKLSFCLMGEQIKQKRRDEEMWRMGLYVQSAVSVPVEHCLAGRKARSKYVEKPFLQEIEEKQEENSNKPLSEEEKKKQTEQLFMKLRIMGANFSLNHSK